MPMALLKRKYLPSKRRPKPPRVHFAFPVHDLKVVYDYAKLRALSPYLPTADASFLLEFYNNYDLDEKQLLKEDAEDVISLLQEELGLGLDVRPKWYFDLFNEFNPNEGGDYESDDEGDGGSESDGSDNLTERGSDGREPECPVSTLADKVIFRASSFTPVVLTRASCRTVQVDGRLIYRSPFCHHTYLSIITGGIQF
ncbi:hypothetical protein EVG20_g4983 [Dentipellis fragilis]|uniref:Uncharacterized protein n=1 Tax=Dentipellis fragilis TaxID=205917 RepID=A0A4Y9YWG7_9AGAM|nr:hypothetical protein EVG20_g4983 [Dentipellis fragilis]